MKSLKGKIASGKGTHYDAWIVGAIVIVVFLIILFTYGQTVVDAIEAFKAPILALFGL